MIDQRGCQLGDLQVDPDVVGRFVPAHDLLKALVDLLLRLGRVGTHTDQHARLIGDDVVDGSSLHGADADHRILFDCQIARLDGLDRCDQTGQHADRVD
ncbi:hypothetical protein D3C75_1007590 [compost metagenome]